MGGGGSVGRKAAPKEGSAPEGSAPFPYNPDRDRLFA
jgi:hypothetical protein